MRLMTPPQLGCSQCTVAFPGPSVAYCGGSTLYLFMSVLETFFRRQCDIEDPCNQFEPVSQPLDEYDFIVVGAGTAGSVVASRLSENPAWKVLVVEAGGNEPTMSQVPALYGTAQKSIVDWQYAPQAESRACLAKGGVCSSARGKVMGGSSVLNGMIYERGSKRDYDDWEEAGNYNWKYDDVLPFFKKSEDNQQINKVDKEYHGVGGVLPVSDFPWQPAISADILKAAEELGHKVGDINGAERTRFTVFQSTTKNGVRFSTAKAFLRPVKDRQNIHFMMNSTVSRVLISDDKRASGVEIQTQDGETLTIMASKEVVVSGGSYNSPQLLLLSGIGDEEELAAVDVPVVHHLPGVGKNLQTQISLAVKFYLTETGQSNYLNYRTAMQYLVHRDGPVSARFAATGFLNSASNNPEDDHPDIQLAFRGYLSACSEDGSVSDVSPNSITVSSYVLRPKSRGYVALQDNAYTSTPKIVFNLLDDPYDAEIVVDGIFQAIDLLSAKALESYNVTLDTTVTSGCEDYEFKTADYWKCALGVSGAPAEHPAGTCKMGPDTEELAVVDPELRVHGIPNLRVADASIMPSIISGYTYATTVMIGEKCADMIKNTWA